MGKRVVLAVLLCVAAAGFAEAGQFRIAPPSNLRKRTPPANYRESRLEIVNRDDRGYAIDVDYRRNRLALVHRSSGDIYLPANSSIILTFDDDDDWRIEGDYESLEIEIRSGRTTTLRLETRTNRNQVGLVGTVVDGGRQYSKQLFRYADRPVTDRPGAAHRSSPQPQPSRQQPNQHNSRTPQQQSNQHNSRTPQQQSNQHNSRTPQQQSNQHNSRTPQQQSNQHNTRTPQQQSNQRDSRASQPQQHESPRGASPGKSADPKDNDRLDPRR